MTRLIALSIVDALCTASFHVNASFSRIIIIIICEQIIRLGGMIWDLFRVGVYGNAGDDLERGNFQTAHSSQFEKFFTLLDNY